MNTRILIFSLGILISFYGSGQEIIPSNNKSFSKEILKKLKKSEDSLKVFGKKMINERTALDRFLADSMFIRMLVRSLKTPYSFNYSYDSLKTISRLYAPDSSFRIFTWEFMRYDDYYRQRGAIQMKTADGSLKLFPLIDISDFTSAPLDSIRTPNNWVGAIYYNIIMKTLNNRNYYTLIGFDDNNRRSTKKWIEVLSFDDLGKPVFGGPFFSIRTDDVRGSTAGARFCLEYKKDAAAKMNYDKDLDMIVYEHLVSEDNSPDKPYSMIPDGDYLGFKWVNGKWIQVDKIFNSKLQDGQAPVPMPLKDAAGKSDEMRLSDQSMKNMQRQKQEQVQPPPSKKPPVKKAEKKPESDQQESF